jgi:SAM-dependent methyltransferase
LSWTGAWVAAIRTDNSCSVYLQVPILMQQPTNFLPAVRSQYEALPYPPCNPEDDRTRLVQTWLEDLPMINHYCFAGKQSFKNNFRALVAGGGTGDATIFLAEQLRATNAQIVHLDMSQASIAIAQQRANIRGLANITWVHDSLLNLPALGLGEFDYINCSGVLHHLADPDAGFNALRSVLKPAGNDNGNSAGAVGLMVYAATGRTAVYQMQALMRLVNHGSAEGGDVNKEIAHTKDILASLPPSNWFVRSQDLHHDQNMGDAGIYDLLLHSQDRAYTVGELFDWLGHNTGNGPLGGHRMHLSFSDVQRGRAPYLPHMVLGSKPPAIAAQLRKLPLRQQYEMAELMVGNIITHSLYATRSADCTAPYGDAQYIPFFYHEPLTGADAARVFDTNHGKPFMLHHQHSGVSVMVNPGRYGAKILALIDGKKSFADLFSSFRADWKGQAAAPDDATLFADFADTYNTLNALERLLLRHPDSLSS